MQPPIHDTRGHLGELAAMARQTEAAERAILEHAEKRLTAAQQLMQYLRAGGLHQAEPQQRYQALTLEVGQLQQVIAQAHQTLGAAAA